jgi:predicted O-methyltransferase YrrM
MFTVDWTTWNVRYWQPIFSSHKFTPSNVLEIGSFEGRTTCWLLDNYAEANVTCVDTWEGSEEHDQSMKDGLFDRYSSNVKRFGERVTVRRGMSGDVLRAFPTASPSFDLVYVDGSHYSRDALEDAVLSWRLLKPGGFMIFDDYTWTMEGTKLDDIKNPRTGIDAFCKIFEPIHIKEIPGQLIVRKPE